MIRAVCTIKAVAGNVWKCEYVEMCSWNLYEVFSWGKMCGCHWGINQYINTFTGKKEERRTGS